MTSRRTFLATTAAATTTSVALSGCLGIGGGDGGSSDALADHPAAAGLDDEPTLGPPPMEADAALVAFSDPSCPHCQTFETETFPRLRENFVQSQRLSFVYRNVAVAREWAPAAIHALEATWARDEAAFWALRRWMYRNPDAVASNPGEAAASFLADNTTLSDPDAVRTAATDRTETEQVTEDEDAMRDAGLDSTPSFVVARDGEVTGTVVGAQSYQTFVDAIGLEE
ncbi:DsbA family protein [Halobacterium rubrum]|uniref:DsbA family protein n=1 Tax=Halobacterium TaxID=2239 RepID=UPI001F3E0508|nr:MULTISPECIES: thioredoxin domain-containing protein [Halobacterium]MDH5018872.1 thioredoxin domain-containing protein [Halobacterium rubrum]